MTTSPSAQEKAQQTAATATEEGKQVAGTAKEEARNVAAEASTQARSVLDDATRQVTEQSRTQRDRLVGTLHAVSSDLQQMSDQSDGSGLASDLVRQASARVRTIGDHLDGREPAELLDDVRAFARRRPGTFLLGALAAGVVAGRLARGAKDAQDGGSSPGTVTPSTPVTAPVAAPVTEPAPAPVPPPYGTPEETTPPERLTGTPTADDHFVSPALDTTTEDLGGRDLR